MSAYRMYILIWGQIQGREDFEAADDVAAIRIAGALYDTYTVLEAPGGEIPLGASTSLIFFVGARVKCNRRIPHSPPSDNPLKQGASMIPTLLQCGDCFPLANAIDRGGLSSRWLRRRARQGARSMQCCARQHVASAGQVFRKTNIQ